MSKTTKKNTASRSGTAKRSTSGRKRTSRSRSTQAAVNPKLRLEIADWLIVLVILLLTLGIFLKDSLGIIGLSINRFFVGVFGFSAYLISVLSLFVAFLNLFGKLDKPLWLKIIAGYVLLVLLSALLHVISGSALDTVKLMYREASIKTGGVVGGVIGGALAKVIGKTGTIIVMIFLILIVAILTTERSLVDGMVFAGHKTKEKTDQFAEYSRERARERAERRLQLRAEREERRKEEEARLAEEKARAEVEKAASDAYQSRSNLVLDSRANAHGDRQIALEGSMPETRKSPESSTAHINIPETRQGSSQENKHGRLKEAVQQDKELSKTHKPAGPVLYHDGPVDIPLISNDRYLARKRMEEKAAKSDYRDPYDEAIFHQKPVKPVKPAENVTDDKPTETVAEVKPAQTLTEVKPAPVPAPAEETVLYTDMEPSANPVPEGSDIQSFYEAPETFESVESTEPFAPASDFDPSNVSTEKVFSKEEFPAGYEDHQETAAKAGLTSSRPMAQKPVGPTGEYHFPPISLLKEGSKENASVSRDDLISSARNLEEVLAVYGVEAKVVQVNRGPAVTRYELQPKLGTSVKKIAGLDGDIAMALAATSIHIEAPIPGKSAVGIEIPNKETTMVTLREVIDSDVFRKASSKLTFSLGKDIDGEVRVADIAKMPHMLIAGATGSGKSVCINSLIMSLIYKAHPDDVKMILIDPKVVELQVYNGIPHLLLPVVNDPKQASATLNWAVQEMTRRYKKFAEYNVRDIRGFNEAVERGALGEDGEKERKMPQMVIIIDELADLMMVASKEVETSICRLAQMARAAGMHLVIATQRPSVDVITGLIKANIPSRIAFAVSSGVDSKTILDGVGAEKLLGKGDMLYAPIGANRPVRIQGTFVSDKEVEDVVEYVKKNGTGAYDTDLTDMLKSGSSSQEMGGIEDEIDEYLEDAIRLVVDKQKASISMMQRAYRIGFNRAARLMDALEKRGVVGPDEGSKPRQVLMTREQWEAEN